MRVEVLGVVERRRRWSQDDKVRIVEETLVWREGDGGCASQRGCCERGVHLATTGANSREGRAMLCTGADYRGGGNGRRIREVAVRG